ncbi:MAG: redoxin domain-containing protein [Pirellulaceae bacterium]
MRRYLMLSATLLAVLTTGLAWGQADTAPTQVAAPVVQLSPAERDFDEIVRGFEKRLTEAGSFTVDVVSQWEATGSGTDAKGTNIFHVAVQAGGKLRVEAGSAEAGESQFVCVSDGRGITRLLRSANLYSQHDAATSLDELQHDNMTLQTLAGSGVEFLVRPQFRAQLIAQIRSVEDVGREMLGTADSRHFRLVLLDNRVFDLWFTTGEQPVLTRLVTTTSLPIDGERTFRFTTTGSFRWQAGVQHAEGTFAVEIPAGARRVHDLLAALQEGDISQLLGQPAPVLQLANLQGTQVSLASQLGKYVVVLIFWARWCAPSTDRMGSLNEFVTSCEKAGAAVYAINLGEDRDTVSRTVTEKGFEGTVLLDPQAQAVQAYRIGAIPLTVLIGKDGTVQAYQAGSSDQVRERIRADAAALISGKTLVPKGS